MNRITPEEVVKAYINIGWKPERAVYFNKEKKCACGFGAMALANVESENNQDLFSWIDSTYTDDYQSGFINGFDGDEITGVRSDEWIIGFKDGKNAWEAVVESGLINEANNEEKGEI